MNLKTLKNIIVESYITEIGDLNNIIPYDYKTINKLDYTFESNVGDVEVKIENLDDYKNLDKAGIQFITKNQIFNQSYNGQTLYNISFTLNGDDSQSLKTNLKEFNRIIKTVTIIIEKFIKLEKPFGLFVSGANRDKTSLAPDKVKNTLWLTIATNLNDNLSGYRIDKGKLGFIGYSFDGFMIYQTNSRKIK